MSQRRLWTALLVVLAATVPLAQSGVPARDVVMAVTLPNGATPQLRIVDGGTGTVRVPGLGRFGFVPRLQERNVVRVDVFDLTPTPDQRLGRIEAVVGGDQVQSGTTPDFAVRIVRVVTR